MDSMNILRKLRELFGKYKFALLILLVGILFISFPEKEPQETKLELHTSYEEPSSADKLEEVLSQIAGVGRVKVYLTESVSAETIYQSDENRTSSQDSESIRTETIIVTNASREEIGLVRAVRSPVYLGAIIVCQGGDNPSTKLSVVQAVSSATGIRSDRITVLKMK